MSEVLEFAARLSQVVGARPAGTEEEQQASFFIEEVMTEAGLDTAVEEFNCNPNYEMPRIACCIASIVLAILAICLPLMVVPALIVCAAAAVFYILEVLGTSPLTNATKGGVSQNVIAKYYPGMGLEGNGEDGLGTIEAPEFEKIDGKNSSGRRKRGAASSDSRTHRKRKIVILARYDSGRVHAELKPPFLNILDKIRWAEIGGMVLVPIALLLRLVTGAVDDMHIVWDILVGIGAFCSLLPVIAYIMHQTASYSEGANNNASGVAVMTEVAKRLIASSKPSLSSKVIPEADGLSFSLPAEIEDSTVIAAVPELGPSGPLPVIHGKDAVLDAGVLPPNTDLIYDEAANGMLEKQDRELIDHPISAEDPAQIQDATVAFMPIEPKLAKEGQSSSQPLHNGRQSALSLEAQMQAASLEFSKYDEQDGSEEDNKNPWIRLQNQSPKGAVGSALIENAENVPPDVTADLKGAKTISISEEPELAEDPNVPDWFKKGMAAASANKAEDEEEKHAVQRSRFADALDAAHESSAQAIENFEGRGVAIDGDKKDFGIDRARIDELHAKIMGESTETASSKDKEAEAEAKAARRAKLKAARDAKNASKEELAKEDLASEKRVADEMAEDAKAIAAIEAKAAAQAVAQAQAAEEVAEQAAVADRTISFIPVAADIPAEVSAKSASNTSSHDPVKKTAEEILNDAASLTGSRRAVSVDEGSEQIGRRSISLPSLTVSKSKKSGLQNAPLAEDALREKGESRTALKNVGGETEYGASKATSKKSAEVKEGVSQSLEGATTNFLQENAEADAMAALSSLDGPSSSKSKASAGRPRSTNSSSIGQQQGKASIPTLGADGSPSAESPISVSTAGSFVQSSQTSNFEPVGNELIANMGEGDIIVEDVDDSDYTENITHTGAIAGPGYVEMPKSRMHRFKSIFGKKKSKEGDSVSFSDAVGIEEGFDAREVGKARGSWESFKSDSSEVAKAPSVQSGPNSRDFSENASAKGGSPSNQAQGVVGAAGMNKQMPSQRQSAPQMPGQAMNQNIQQGMPQMRQQGPFPMPANGQGQNQMPMPMGRPPQGQFPMPQSQPQGQPQGQRPMQGRMPQQMPPQGQVPPQYQGQQFQMPQQMPKPQQFPGQMQGQPFPGNQMPMQAGPAAQQPPISMPSNNPSSDISEPSEKATKKSHSFSFFKKRGKDGDMNSGAFDDADWNGGAFSLGRDKDSSEKSSRQRSGSSSRSSRHASRNQGASAGRRRSADEVLAEEAMADMEADELMAQDMLEERDQIRNFRASSTQLTSFEEVAAFASSFSKKAASNAAADGGAEIISVEEEPDIGFQTEVWFVALGAELANNAGIKTLLAEHGDEMRGAVIIDIDALGAGQLSLIEEEGVIKRVKSSSRMKRYATKAATALGIKLGTGKMLWRESAAYYTSKRGLPTLHLCGMEGGKPAYAGDIEDTFDKLSEETLLENTAFILELVNAI